MFRRCAISLGVLCFLLPGARSDSAQALYSLTDLGVLPGGSDYSWASGINASGQVAGFCSAATGYRPFLWTNGSGLQDLGDLPGGENSGEAYGINASGQVVGTCDTPTGYRAFLWTSGSGMQGLGELPGGNGNSQAIGINAGGQVVGESNSATGDSAFLWTSKSGMQDLNNLLDASGNGWALKQADGINDRGQIVGYGVHNGVTHGFLLTPTPEPSTLVLFGISTVSLLG
jgi:probable HAF family extracellular repeat protein